MRRRPCRLCGKVEQSMAPLKIFGTTCWLSPSTTLRQAQDRAQDRPCLTARPNTERPVTITRGTNQLVASSRPAIVQAARNVLNYQHRHGALDRPELWDGRAAERIIGILRLQEGAR